MASFDKYAPTLKQWEGGFVNDPRDAGGATNMGVTLATFRQWYGASKTVTDLKNMTDAQWNTIMKGGFWDKMKADQINNQSVAEIMVDWLVNSGVGKIKNIQQVLGVSADGIVGNQTLSAINSANQQQLHFKIKKARAAFYAGCVDTRSTNIAFYDGWMRRLAGFLFKK